MKRLSEQSPIKIAVILTITVFVIRIIELFFLRVDQLIGEQVVTKTLGLIIILFYLRAVKSSPRKIGLHAENWKSAVAAGLIFMGAALVTGYAAEWVYLYATGAKPALVLATQSHILGEQDLLIGGSLLVFILVAGNIINSFMEEGLFRGILITHLSTGMKMGRANLIQAVVFGVWHIAIPIRDCLDGKMSIPMAFGTSLVYIVFSGLIGFVWGYYFQKTGSLWVSWTAHTLNNTTLNFLNVTTAQGMPETMPLRVLAITLASVALLPLFKKYAAAKVS